jgi:hypothetical protein
VVREAVQPGQLLLPAAVRKQVQRAVQAVVPMQEQQRPGPAQRALDWYMQHKRAAVAG